MPFPDVQYQVGRRHSSHYFDGSDDPGDWYLHSTGVIYRGQYAGTWSGKKGGGANLWKNCTHSMTSLVRAVR